MRGIAGDWARAGCYHVSLILTLTINPAVDRTVTVDKLVFEDRGYILNRDEGAGGRGINASHVIHAFGGKTLALLTAGGAPGQTIEKSLAGMRFPFETVRVRSDSRINLTISDKQGLTVKLNEVGAPLEKGEVEAIRKLVEARLPKARWLMICGSVQPHVPPNFYQELVERAQKHGVKTLLDADGDALHMALDARPTVITPNQPEAERLLGRALLTRSQFLEALQRIRAMGPESVILSLGSRGAVASVRRACLKRWLPGSRPCVQLALAMPWPPRLCGVRIRRRAFRIRCGGASPRGLQRRRCQGSRFRVWN